MEMLLGNWITLSDLEWFMINILVICTVVGGFGLALILGEG